MPRIFDNIEQTLLPALQQTVELSDRADFCVGYFNLRGWRRLDSHIEKWSGGPGHCCRLLVGMHRPPEEELREALSLAKRDGAIDHQTVLLLKRRMAEHFRDQLTIGVPTNEDEAGLRRLAAQIKAKKVVVKLFLRHRLHAKLYLLFRPDPISPSVGYLGSSNLTFAGLSQQGELNIDVLEQDACQKLAKWFEERWNDRWCVDISDDLVRVIEESWARETLVPPYHIYLKMAYHLSQEARAGLTEFQIPRDFGRKLFEFQIAAVKIAAHHLNKRGGVLIGDVVGLGKTLMATALARIFEDDYLLETLIICPANLVKMWEDYRLQHHLRAKVLSLGQVTGELADLRRFRIVIIDESQNLRNREGKRYRAIQEYIQKNESRVILLSATPYNKTYLDLSNQLRLFVPPESGLGIRPDRLIRDIGEIEFIRRYQCQPHTLAAFEHSDYPDDWRELMRLYMVRRTRSFIQENYADTDTENGRKYLTFEDGTRSYFPTRIPKRAQFTINDKDPNDQYARLYADDVVHTINDLDLPRYGLGNYIVPTPDRPPTQTEARHLADLSRAGKRLKGFCRTNLFKRLESSGQAFLQSIERHILRNYVYLHAIERQKELPVGTLDAGSLDARIYDEDVDAPTADLRMFDDDDFAGAGQVDGCSLRTEADFRRRAAEVYEEYASRYKSRFKWLRPSLFEATLEEHLHSDSQALLDVLQKSGEWNPTKDTKLARLLRLLMKEHRNEKVIVFTQFADTVRYLEAELKKLGVSDIEGVTGDSPDPTGVAWRFSPVSSEKREQVKPDEELRVVVATDVLSEGQNLQDCHIVVNYDLPWAIIRLVQRAGRVDRIGQRSENILCYSFLPADGVERIIRLRTRVRQRLQENAEVVGTDEAFFEDDRNDRVVLDLYNEKSGLLDGDVEGEVDLASYAYQIWKNATDANPDLQKIIPGLQAVVYSTKAHKASDKEPEGVLVYLRTAEDNDALAWIDKNGNSVTESQLSILRAAECPANTPALPRSEKHHELVLRGVETILKEEKSVGGGLGRPSGARFRTYERLKRYAEEVKGQLFDTPELRRAIEDIYRYPLRQVAVDTLNRQLRSGVSDEVLAELVITLREEGRLCQISKDGEQTEEPRIICSLGLSGPEA